MPRIKREIPWLDKRNGVYYVFWYDEKTRRTERLSFCTKDVDEAQARYAAFLAEGKAAFARRSSTLGVSSALDYYFEEHLQKESTDPRTSEAPIQNLQAYFGEKPINEIGVPECRAYAEARINCRVNGRNRPAKDSTVARELRILKAAAYHNLKWKRIKLDQMPTFELPQAPDTKGVYLFKDELKLLFDAAAKIAGETIPGRTQGFIRLCYYTGSRRGAIERLTWPQVSVERGRISLASANERQTKKRRPTIPIDPLLLPTLQDLHANKINEYVLGSNGSMTDGFEKAAALAGLLDLPDRDGRPAARLTPHMLRHSRATHLLQDGKDPYAVASLLGDTLQTVLRVYGHHCPNYLSGLFDDANSGALRANGSEQLLQFVA